MNATKVDLLKSLANFTREAVKEIRLPTINQNDMREPIERAPEVYLCRLPQSAQYKKKAPYIIHQLVTSTDTHPAGEQETTQATVRSIFCVYNHDEQEGGLNLLQVMERIRIELLKTQVLDKTFILDMDSGVEYMVYTDDLGDFYGGEMITVWHVPAVEREVFTWKPQEKSMSISDLLSDD